MQIVQALGDISPSDAAIFLKVVAKGIARDLEGKKKLAPFKTRFFEGCAKRGIPKKDVETLWDQIIAMTTYAFNKSHSAGYALQGYQDQWLKQKATLEEYASLLTTETDKVAAIIRESRSFGISVLPPDVNSSNEEFTIDGNAIRFGLLAIKDVGHAAIQEIIAKRPYDSYEDFESKVEKRKCNSKVKKALVESGAFDTFGMRDEMSEEEKAAGELGRLGFIVGREPPVEKYRDLIEERIDKAEMLGSVQEQNGEVWVGGEVISVREGKDRNGNPYAFVTVQFDEEVYNLAAFSGLYEKMIHLLTEGQAILCIGEYDHERDSVTAKHVIAVEQLANELKDKK